MTTALLAPVLPGIETVVDGEALADEILLSAAASEKVQRIGGRARPINSSEPAPTRAWTRSGNVD